jgi:hypothetical protein
MPRRKHHPRLQQRAVPRQLQHPRIQARILHRRHLPRRVNVPLRIHRHRPKRPNIGSRKQQLLPIGIQFHDKRPRRSRVPATVRRPRKVATRITHHPRVPRRIGGHTPPAVIPRPTQIGRVRQLPVRRKFRHKRIRLPARERPAHHRIRQPRAPRANNVQRALRVQRHSPHIIRAIRPDIRRIRHHRINRQRPRPVIRTQRKPHRVPARHHERRRHLPLLKCPRPSPRNPIPQFQFSIPNRHRPRKPEPHRLRPAPRRRLNVILQRPPRPIKHHINPGIYRPVPHPPKHRHPRPHLRPVKVVRHPQRLHPLRHPARHRRNHRLHLHPARQQAETESHPSCHKARPVLFKAKRKVLASVRRKSGYRRER